MVGKLQEPFKLKYRGKKAANDYYLNYSRGASVCDGTLTYITESNKIVMYDLDQLDEKLEMGEPIPKIKESIIWNVGKEVQDFCIPNIRTIIALTEDCFIIKASITGKAARQSKELKIPDKTMPSTIYTELAVCENNIVVVGYRDFTGSNVYDLLDTSLTIKDTVEIKNIDKQRPTEEHHIHKMEMFVRSNLVHLLSINIACSLNLFVIYLQRLHPVKVAYRISDGNKLYNPRVPQRVLFTR